jgi:hypothetical protein
LRLSWFSSRMTSGLAKSQISADPMKFEGAENKKPVELDFWNSAQPESRNQALAA